VRGWRVTAADWRGQAGSGRLGADAVTGHIDDFTLWVNDLAAFWREWSQDRTGPLVLAGHSMGGHLALRAVAERAVRPDALILSAPMLGFLPEAMPNWAQLAAARLMGLVGDPRRPAWKWSEKPGELPAGRAALLTHDDERYADESWWRAERPELAMGTGSWGWTRAAIESNMRLAQTGVLEAIELPVLLLAAREDRLVGFRAIERAAGRIPNNVLAVFADGARHELLREADEVRDRVLAAIDTFLERLFSR